MLGSSPLTRGKRNTLLGRNIWARLIPAHAGKTRRRRVRSWGSRAHPRSRGENKSAVRCSSVVPGSSPLTRGKLSPPHMFGRFRRLIPAHAGKTFAVMVPSNSVEAHPRSRGENICEADGGGDAGGSSPLTRGKRS
ncbi:hypothetical protein ACTODO_00505 [Schaalia dentiphila ATCC 17982]|nr:hypothetical protein ACTODO_00505 [Schaalia odontolytica ATCC 17982]